MRSPKLLISGVLLLALATACAPAIQVSRLQPAPYNLGATRSVAVLDVRASRDDARLVWSELQHQVLDRGYFALHDAQASGLSFVVRPGMMRVEIASIRPRIAADAYVVAHVHRIDFYEESHYERVDDDARDDRKEQRKRRGRLVMTPHARATIEFQVVRQDGRVVVAETYEGHESGPSRGVHESLAVSPEKLIRDAVSEAVSEFLSDITPRRVVERIELDDDDRALVPGVKLAGKGDLAGAEQAWREVVRQNPRAAGAIYNLGVLLETRGEFDQAAEHYQRAFDISARPLYRRAGDALQRRLGEAASLQEPL